MFLHQLSISTPRFLITTEVDVLVCLLTFYLTVAHFSFGEPLELVFWKQPMIAAIHNQLYDFKYLINFTVSTPPQALQVELDTGSRAIWVI